MIRAFYRKGRADIASRPLQSILLFVVLTGAAATVMIAFSARDAASAPFERVHEQANGAHVWFEGVPENLHPITELSGVAASTDIYEQVRGTLVDSPQPIGLKFWAMTPDIPEVSPAVLVAGEWLTGSGDEVVIEWDLARRRGLDIGDEVKVSSAMGSTTLRIVGLVVLVADSPGAEPIPTFVASATVRLLAGGSLDGLSVDELDARRANYGLGVRLDDPEATAHLVERAEESARALGLPLRSLTWQQIADEVALESEGFGILFTVFAIFALAATGLIIANTITTHVLARRREIGILKAVGFAPRHVSLLLLSEQLAVGLVATLVGIGVGVLLTPVLVAGTADLLATTSSPNVVASNVVVTLFGVMGLVVIFTLLPAWRAGRISAVDAIADGHTSRVQRPSRIAGAARRLGMPTFVVYGVKDAFARPVRAWLGIAGVAVAAATVMLTLTYSATLNNAFENPVEVGYAPSEVKVIRLPGFGTEQAASRTSESVSVDLGAGLGVADPMSEQELIELIDSNNQVEAYVTSRSLLIELAGDTTSGPATAAESSQVYTGSFVSGPIERFGFHLAQGVFFTAPNEAIVDLKLARERGIEVGDELSIVVHGADDQSTATVPIAVTGIYVSRPGGSILLGLDTLRAINPEAEAGDLLLKLDADVDTAHFAEELFATTGGRVLVDDQSSGLTEDEDGNRAIIPFFLGLNLVLVGLAGTNLLSSQIFAVRERTREFGIVKTIGFTPRQVVASVIAGAVLLTAVGVVLGALVGFAFTYQLLTSLVAENGLAGGFVQFPSFASLLIFAPLIAAVAILGAAIPARRASRLSVADTLRYE